MLTRPSPPRATLRLVALFAALNAALLAAHVAAPRSLTAQAPPATSYRDPLVVVSWFDNRSGDASLDLLNGWGAGWIADALAAARVARVVPSREVRRLMTGTGASPTDIASRTGATLLVRGAFTKAGDQLSFSTELVDVATGKVLTTSGPASGTVSDNRAYDALFQDLATAIDMYRLWRPSALFWPRPRRFLTWRTWQEANANFFSKSDWAGALPGYLRAAAMDTGWVLAKYGIWVANGNLGRVGPSDSMEAVLRPLMTARPGALHDVFDWLSASHRWDREGMYQAAKKRAASDPVGEAYTLALPAARTGRFAEVVALYQVRDTTDEWVASWRPWDFYALQSLHLLGRHDEELGVARANLTRRGLDYGTGNAEVTALAALGRTAELDAALKRLEGVAPYGGNTFGGSLVAAGWELIVHGSEGVGREMFRRRLALYSAMPAEQRAIYGIAIANSQLMIGDYPAAMRGYDSLTKAAPDNMAHWGHLGVGATLARNKTLAAQVEARLSGEQRPRLKAAALYWRSVMAALAGDCARATPLRREAVAAGYTLEDYTFHRWNAVGKARSCKELAAVTAPRGGT